MQSFEAILFDFDGTLADSYEAITASVNHVRASRGHPPLDQDAVRRFVGRGPAYLLENTVPGTDVVQDLLLYRAHHPAVMLANTRLLPGALDCLTGFWKRGLKLGVCSNKPSVFTRQILDHLQIGRFLQIVLGPEDVPSIKPAPDMVQKALKVLGVEPSRALYVGDMVVDIETARGAGVTAWVVATGSDQRQALEQAAPDAIFRDLTEVSARLL